MYQVYLGLGSNLGDRIENLTRAVELVSNITTVHSTSSIYETEPVDMSEGGLFLNMVIGCSTPNDPPLLMTELKSIEKKIGRRLPSHGEPRIIDIDILLYRGLAYQDTTVTVPHPLLEHRRFALEPLCEVAPTTVHPTLEKTIATLLRNCRDQHRVIRSELTLNLLVSH